MERGKVQNVDEILNALFDQYGLSGRMKEMRIINGWKGIVGNTIAEATKRIDICNKVLFLKIDSPALRNELMMIRNNLKDVINKRAGEEIINDIIIK